MKHVWLSNFVCQWYSLHTRHTTERKQPDICHMQIKTCLFLFWIISLYHRSFDSKVLLTGGSNGFQPWLLHCRVDGRQLSWYHERHRDASVHTPQIITLFLLFSPPFLSPFAPDVTSKQWFPNFFCRVPVLQKQKYLKIFQDLLIIRKIKNITQPYPISE